MRKVEFKGESYMKKRKIVLLIIIVGCTMYCLCGCSQKEPSVVKTYEKTDSERSSPNSEPVIMVKHYEMSDGTWKTDEYTYQYRLEITGRMNNAVKDSTFIFFSNIEDITFDQAWKAAGFSSNMDDYFDVEDAKFVGFGGNTVVQDIDYSEDTYIYEDTDADTEEMEIESTEFIPTEN